MKQLETNPAFGQILARAALFTFEDFWHFKTQPFKQKAKREIRYVELEGRPFFLKKYYEVPWWKRSEAETEWEGAFQLLKEGFSVPLPVAFGREVRFLSGRAFTMFQAAPGRRAEDCLREALNPELVWNLARVAGRFHAAGFSHQDFYLCHFFWAAQEKRLTIIDLGRLRKAPSPRKRWVIKDLAELFYSVRQTLSPSDQRRFEQIFWNEYRHWLPWVQEQGFYKAIERKIRRIAQHDAKLKASN